MIHFGRTHTYNSTNYHLYEGPSLQWLGGIALAVFVALFALQIVCLAVWYFFGWNRRDKQASAPQIIYQLPASPLYDH
jgi:hypothetical protein